MKAISRPWRLEVEEPDMIDGSPTWALWSTYQGEDNAVDRRDRLEAKGYTVRVVNTDTGEVAGERCPFCDSTHATPSSGECLI